MSNIKELLKEAKVELAREDYDDAVSISKKVLKLDADNYFAYVFLGKSYSCLPGKGKEAVENYKSAIKVDATNLLAWKGLFLFLKSQSNIQEIVSYDEYFELCGKYGEVLVEQQLPLIDLIHDIRVFRKKYPDCEESFLSHMVPGAAMAEQFGRHLITLQEALQKLITLTYKKEEAKISKLVSRERLKLSVQDPSYHAKISNLAWEIYESSKLDQLYNQLINITDDDDERSDLEIKWLEYRIKVLKSMPKDIKPFFSQKVKGMVEDMIQVDHKSLLAWKLYFEWQDYDDLDRMDQDLILKFFKKFPIEPISVILYAWVSSNLSKYNIKTVSVPEERSSIDEQSGLLDMDESEKKALNEMMEQENDMPSLLEDEVVTALTDNIPKAKSSILAHRIISQYFVISREYEAAQPYVKSGISLVAFDMRDLGLDLLRSKREFTLDLAIIYTYIDAPKNHTAALSLFEKILGDDPENARAKMGKGLIYMERNDWRKANSLLTEVVSQFPHDMEVLSELGWNEAQLGDLEDAIIKFTTVLSTIEGTDLRSCEFRSLNCWRLARVYLMKQEKETPEDQSYVKIAFSQLILSIKVLDTYAPSYSALGDIYCTYYFDNLRAFKCYYKAFELDAGDIVAAKYMTSYYAEMRNWKAASLVAERLIKSEKAKRKLKEVNWAYKVVGIFYLENQQEADSIEWFQSSLRVSPEDIESWVGLGQAYYACGRIEASIKVFDRALELDPQHLYCLNLKAQSLSFVGNFTDSVSILDRVIKAAPNEELFQASLSEVLVSYAMDLYLQGLLTKAISTAKRCISILTNIITKLSCHGHSFWVSVSEALGLFTLVRSKIDDLPIEDLVAIFDAASLSKNKTVLNDLDNVSVETLLSNDKESNISITCKFLILSAKHAISTTNFDELTRTVRSSLWYNIGSAELSAFHILKDVQYQKAAIECFKKAIQYQSNMCESWVGLGIATMDVSYKVSQHCFIKASTLAPKDINVWFNLAMLGLKNDDLEFTKDVLARSQSIAPQESSPWLGLALVYERDGDILGSYQKFGHAFVLSNGKSKVAQLFYAKSILQNRMGHASDERDLKLVEELTAAAYGLDEYFKKVPDDPFALQCALIILERLHVYSAAHKVASDLVQCLERRFEHSQENSELFNFAVIKAQLARIQLGLGNYESAIEDASLSQSILMDFSPDRIASAFTSNHIVLGLAYFFSNDFDQTLVHLEELLKLSKNMRPLVILAAKVLYTVGSNDAKEIALQELMDYISINGADLFISLTIAAISIVEDKKEEMNALLEEFEVLSLQDIISDKHKDVPYLIERIKKGLGLATSNSATWQKSAFFFMNDFKVWRGINSKIEQRVASGGQNKVSALQLSNSYCSLRNLKSIQRSIFLSPTNSKAVAALRGCF